MEAISFGRSRRAVGNIPGPLAWGQGSPTNPHVSQHSQAPPHDPESLSPGRFDAEISASSPQGLCESSAQRLVEPARRENFRPQDTHDARPRKPCCQSIRGCEGLRRRDQSDRNRAGAASGVQHRRRELFLPAARLSTLRATACTALSSRRTLTCCGDAQNEICSFSRAAPIPRAFPDLRQRWAMQSARFGNTMIDPSSAQLQQAMQALKGTWLALPRTWGAVDDMDALARAIREATRRRASATEFLRQSSYDESGRASQSPRDTSTSHDHRDVPCEPCRSRGSADRHLHPFHAAIHPSRRQGPSPAQPDVRLLGSRCHASPSEPICRACSTGTRAGCSCRSPLSCAASRGTYRRRAWGTMLWRRRSTAISPARSSLCRPDRPPGASSLPHGGCSRPRHYTFRLASIGEQIRRRADREASRSSRDLIFTCWKQGRERSDASW